MKEEYLVIGGGINGLLTAYYLHQAGATVAVIEQGETGKESSWAGGGILSPLYPWRYAAAVTQLVSWSQQVYPQLSQQLAESTGINPEWLKSGLLIQNVEDYEQARNWCEHYQIHHQWLTESQLREQFPAVSAAKGPDIWMEDVAQIRNPRLMKSLTKYLKNQKIRILTGEKVRDISVKNGKLSAIHTNNQTLSCEAACLACGAWIQQLVPKGYLPTKIEPVKGQMILLQSTPNLINYIVLRNSHYIIPRNDGKILVGSTLEKTGYDKSITQVAKKELFEFAGRIVPELNNNKVVNHWAGLRPGSPSGIPYICEHPEIEGLFINGGQFRNGVTMGPASGQLMANVMLHEQPIVNTESYQLAAAGKLSPVQQSY